MECCGNLAHSIFCRLYLDVCHALCLVLGHILAEHSLCSQLHSLRHKLVAVYLGTLHCHEEMTFLDTARVDVHASDFDILAAYDSNHGDVFEQFLKFHFYC